MATESYLVTALPYSAAPGEEFHVSLFVTHRLTPDGSEGTLGDFAITREWTRRLAEATITLRGGGAGGGDFEIPCTAILSRLDAALWPRVFPATLPVRPWRVPDYTATPWRTFPAHRMQQHALLLHGASILSSPVTPPSVLGNALTEPLLEALGVHPRMLTMERLFDRGRNGSGPMAGGYDIAITDRLDELTEKGGLAGDRAAGGDSPALLPLLTDLHRARRFYQRDEDATPYRDRPLDGATAAAITKPTPDFHGRAGMLGDLSPLLRKLGLVIDLRVSDVGRLASASWIQADITFARVINPVRRQPRTACKASGHTFTAVSSTGDYELGMLKLADEGRFTVLDLDPDASALKLEQFVRTVPRLVAVEGNGDPATSAPSTLRATGIAVARRDRARMMFERADGAAAKDAALLGGNAPMLTLEQVNRGLRLEVWDDVSGKWHSLHQRLLTVTVTGAGEILSRVSDTGFLQGASLSHSDSVTEGPKYAHEVLAGWDGWSLSAPRPGKVVVHENGEERLLDAPEPDASPVNPVHGTSEVAPGTLPRLRYGRSYALRAYAVDLAGNSRPHAIGGVGASTGGPDRPRPVPGPRPSPGNVPRPVPGRPQDGAGASSMVVLDEREATEHATRRMETIAPDATRGANRNDRNDRVPDMGALLRDGVRALRTARDGAREGVLGDSRGGVRGERGIDPAGITVTGVPEVDRLIAARIGARAAGSGRANVTRGAHVERLFDEASADAPFLMERTDVQTDARATGNALRTMLAGQPGLGAAVTGRPGGTVADLLTVVSDLVTTPRPFLRWDPVIEPVTVPRHAFTEGESLLRLVVRSGVTQDAPGELALTITPPDAYAAATLAEHPTLGLAWRESSQRHLAPPKTSQFEAEAHGAFDSAIGDATPAAARTALGVALRESGTFLDTTIADIANPGARLPQPGVTFHVTPTADAPRFATPASLPKGDPLGAGQYVAHDVDRLVLPYLPDPLAAGVSFTFPDAGAYHRLTGLLAIEGTTLRYSGTWPERQPFRLVLESGPELGAVVEDHVIRLTLPPGEMLRVRMSSALTKASLDLFGLWRSLPAAVRNNALLREAAADGWFWWLTPHTELRLVHAVPRPVEVPRPTLLYPRRKPSDTAVVLVGAVDVHAPSTERIDIEGRWTEWVDDIAKPEPERVSRVAAACGTAIAPDEDLVVLAGEDASAPMPDGSTLRVHAAVHQTGDTKHRTIDYRVRATTRYREYFLPQVTPDVDSLSVVGPTRTLDVPSSARPPKVAVKDVIPLFRWHEETEPAQPFGLRRTRRAGVRVYLERPWYASGDGELLAVLLATGTNETMRGSVSQWGGDPVWLQQGPSQRTSLPLTDLLHLTGIDDRIEAARPVGPPVVRPLVDLPGSPNVWVLGYQPEYSKERALWFVDIALDPGTAFWPFVQLAVARYQPSALPGLHLGPVLQCDFVQLTPERTATLSRTDDRHARALVTGAIGLPRLERGRTPVGSGLAEHVAASRTMRARLEKFDTSVGTDLAWETVSQQDLPVLGVDGAVVTWGAEIPLPVAVPPRTPGSSTRWRVTLEEWEWLPADTGAGGKGGLQPRIVYAEHLPL